MNDLLSELVSLLKKYPGPRPVIEKIFDMALKKIHEQGTSTDGQRSFCECGGRLEPSGGCLVCRSCGFSKCG